MAKMIRLKKKHSKKCWNKPKTEWFPADTPILTANIAGNKTEKRGNYCHWLEFSCNDSQCEGLAIVRVDTLSDFIRKGLKKK